MLQNCDRKSESYQGSDQFWAFRRVISVAAAMAHVGYSMGGICDIAEGFKFVGQSFSRKSLSERNI
jgi:hypothetical protein